MMFHFQTPLYDALRQVASDVWSKHMRNGVSAILHNRTGILSCIFFKASHYPFFSIFWQSTCSCIFSLHVTVNQFGSKIPYYQYSTWLDYNVFDI